jgi:hypothetical protein
MKRVVQAVLVLSLAVPGSAQAATWSSPQLVGSSKADRGGGANALLAVTSGGAALASWTPVVDNSSAGRQAAVTPAKGAWKELAATPNTTAHWVAAGSSERLEVWDDFAKNVTDSPTRIRTRITAANGKAGAIKTLVDVPGKEDVGPLVAAGAGSRFAIALHQASGVDVEDPGRLRLFLRAGAGKAFTEVTLPAEPRIDDSEFGGVSLAIDAKGRVAVAVVDADNRVAVLLRQPDGTDGGWQRASTKGAVGEEQVAFAPNGDVVVVWTQADQAVSPVVAASAGADGKFGPEVTLDDKPAPTPISLSSGSRGVIVTWLDVAGTTFRGAYKIRADDGTWSDQATLVTAKSPAVLSKPRVVETAKGKLLGAWRLRTSPATTHAVYAASESGGKWAGVTRLSSPGQQVANVSLAAGGPVVHVLWDGYVAKTKRQTVFGSRIRP